MLKPEVNHECLFRYHSDGFHPNAVHFADFKESDILWHYLKTRSIHEMHKIFTYSVIKAKLDAANDKLYRLENRGCTQ